MKDARPGQVLPVEDDYHYPLPAGLKTGDVVRLVAFDHGYWTVEKDGQQFRVFMCCVQSGFEYEIGGRWVLSNSCFHLLTAPPRNSFPIPAPDLAALALNVLN